MQLACPGLLDHAAQISARRGDFTRAMLLEDQRQRCCRHLFAQLGTDLREIRSGVLSKSVAHGDIAVEQIRELNSENEHPARQSFLDRIKDYLKGGSREAEES
jgi:hypothetical protein